MTLDGLNELNRAFMQADSDGSGTLELEEFKKVVKEAFDIKGRVSLKGDVRIFVVSCHKKF